MGVSYKRKHSSCNEETDAGLTSADDCEAEPFETTRTTFKKLNQSLRKKRALLPIKEGGKLIHKEQEISDAPPAQATASKIGSSSEDPTEPVEANFSGHDESDSDEPSMARLFDEFADSSDEEGLVSGEDDLSGSDNDTGKSEAERLVSRKAKIEEYMLRIGCICSDIVENPEEQYKRLNELLQMTKMGGAAGFFIKRVAIASLGEIFADILPEYKIKEVEKPTSTGPRLKKETRQIMAYERTLLKLYKRFLVVCEDFIQLQYRALRLQRRTKLGVLKSIAARRNRRLKQRRAPFRALPEQDNDDLLVHVPPHLLQLARAAVQALARVFMARPYFNYRDKLAAVIVNNLVNRDQAVADICYDCLKTVYKGDQLGEAVFECVKRTKLLVKSYTARLPPKVLYSLLNLRISKAQSVEQQAIDLKRVREQLTKLSRSERKHHKKLQRLDRQLLEARAAANDEQKTRVHTEILKQLIHIYFWILKRTERDRGRGQLLTPLLEGLSKYAHLLNIEFFDDLLNVLHRLMEDEELTDGQTCHCLLTVFKILYCGQGRVLAVDPTRFFSQFYVTLLSLNACVQYDFTPVALQCLDLTLVKGHENASPQRLLAYTKRLLSVALQTGDASTLALLSQARTLMVTHRMLDVLLDHEVGSGKFRPELADPEHANAASASLWECSLLSKHYVPMVRRMAALVAEGSRGIPDKFVSNMAKATPSQVYGAFKKRDVVDICDDISKSRRSITSKPMFWNRESFVSKAETTLSLLDTDDFLWELDEYLS